MLRRNICQNNCHVLVIKNVSLKKLQELFNDKSCYKIKLSLKNYVAIVESRFMNADYRINRPILLIKLRHLQKFS